MSLHHRWYQGGAPRGVKPGHAVRTRKPNRRTLEVLEVFDRHPGFCPVEQMIMVAKDEATPLELKIVVLRELAQYLYPKKKAIEVSGTVRVDAGVLYLGDPLTAEDLALASGRTDYIDTTARVEPVSGGAASVPPAGVLGSPRSGKPRGREV